MMTLSPILTNRDLFILSASDSSLFKVHITVRPSLAHLTVHHRDPYLRTIPSKYPRRNFRFFFWFRDFFFMLSSHSSFVPHPTPGENHHLSTSPIARYFH